MTMKVFKKKTEQGKHQIPLFNPTHPVFTRIITGSCKRLSLTSKYGIQVSTPHSKATDKLFPFRQQQTHGYTTQKHLWSSIEKP